MADDPAPMTVLERFLSIGISRESFAAHLAAGRIEVGGQVVRDAATPAPKPVSVRIGLGDAAPDVGSSPQN